MLHERIRELRISKEMTQEELAKFLDVSPSTIGMYEQGRRNPDNETLLKIAKYFNVSTDYLLTKTDVREPYDLEGEEFIQKLRNLCAAEGIDISKVTDVELAKKIIKAYKLDELYKSD